MSWERDILDTSPDELVRRNSASFLAHLLHRAVQNYLDEAERHRNEIARIRAALTEAERVGLRVKRLEARGRKTVRIHDLMEDA